MYFSSCFIKNVISWWVTYTGSSKIYSSINRGSILSVFTFIYFCPLFLQNYSLMFTYLDNVNFSIFISFYIIFFCTSNDQSIFFLVSIWRLCKLFQISLLEYQNVFTISGWYVTKPTMVKYVNTHIHFYAYCIRSFAIVVIYG